MIQNKFSDLFLNNFFLQMVEVNKFNLPQKELLSIISKIQKYENVQSIDFLISLICQTKILDSTTQPLQKYLKDTSSFPPKLLMFLEETYQKEITLQTAEIIFSILQNIFSDSLSFSLSKYYFLNPNLANSFISKCLTNPIENLLKHLFTFSSGYLILKSKSIYLLFEIKSINY
jgi:hypothetical protein